MFYAATGANQGFSGIEPVTLRIGEGNTAFMVWANRGRFQYFGNHQPTRRFIKQFMIKAPHDLSGHGVGGIYGRFSVTH
jgi:hypothetical protein